MNNNMGSFVDIQKLLKNLYLYGRKKSRAELKNLFKDLGYEL